MDDDGDFLQHDDPQNILGLSKFINTEKKDPAIDAAKMEKQILEHLDGFEPEPVEDPVTAYDNSIQKILGSVSSKQTPKLTMDTDFDFHPTSASIDAPSKPTFNFPDDQGYDSFRKPMHKQITDDQVEQNYINKLISSKWGGSVPDQQEQIPSMRLDEYRIGLLEEIDDFKSDLKNDVDLSTIPEVNYNSPLRDIETVHIMLKKKYERVRYSNLGGDYILMLVYLGEWIFDGKKEYFGVRPCLKGVSRKVKVKLRRIRHDVSQIVNQMLNESKMGPLMKVGIEILPTIFIHNQLNQGSEEYKLDSNFYDAQNNLGRFDAEKNERD